MVALNTAHSDLGDVYYPPKVGVNCPPLKIGHRRTPTVHDFPLPAAGSGSGTFSVTKRDQGLVSPAQSSFTFLDVDDESTGSREQAHAAGTSNHANEDYFRNNSFSRKNSDAMNSNSNIGLAESTSGSGVMMRSPNDGSSESHVSTDSRDRVHRDAVIVAEVKTNVIIRDEFQFLQDLSAHLSQRFQRPTSSIFITLDHSACLLFAGSFDSAYVLTITALATQINPTTNKRNAALTQSFMASSLGVLPDRGIIRFQGIQDEFLATSGTTIMGQVERLHKVTSNTSISSSITSPISAPAISSATTTNSHGTIGTALSPLSVTTNMTTPPPLFSPESASAGGILEHTHTGTNGVGSRCNTPLGSSSVRSRRGTGTQRSHKPPALSLVPKSRSTPGSKMPSPTLSRPRPTMPTVPPEPGQNQWDKKAEKVQKLGKRKSFLAMFGK